MLLSNIGIFGTLLFAIFVARLLMADLRVSHPSSRETTAVLRAAKAGIITVLISAATSGTVYDLGLMFYILAGSISALSVGALQIRSNYSPQLRTIGELQ